MKWVPILVLLLAPTAWPQVAQVDLGSGTTFTGSTAAEGGGLTIYNPNSTWYAGLAYENGHLILGASDTILFHGYTTTIGDKMLGFNFDNVGLAVALKGISVQKRWKKTSLTAFVGMTGPAFFVPFVQVTRAQQFGSGILIQHEIRNFKFYSLDVIDGGKITLAQGLDWNLKYVKLSGSGGLINNQRYFDGRIVLSPFKSLSLVAAHESYFNPYPAQGNSISGNLGINRFTLEAGINESLSRGVQVSGATFGGGFRVGPVVETTNWYKSEGKLTTVENITENIRRFTLVETINDSGGQKTFAFGGGYRSNHFSVSLTHNVQFLLTGQGYQQTTGINISFRLRDVTTTASTITTPYGKVLWSIAGETYRQLPGGIQVAGHETHGSGGKYLITGTCKLQDGTGVEGCSVDVAGKGDLVYSDSRGEFEIRRRQNKIVKITVDPKSFVGAGNYKVLTAPDSATPGGMPIEIIVDRIK